jgi:hypothetical protein
VLKRSKNDVCLLDGREGGLNEHQTFSQAKNYKNSILKANFALNELCYTGTTL